MSTIQAFIDANPDWHKHIWGDGGYRWDLRRGGTRSQFDDFNYSGHVTPGGQHARLEVWTVGKRQLMDGSSGNVVRSKMSVSFKAPNTLAALKKVDALLQRALTEWLPAQQAADAAEDSIRNEARR